MPQTALKQIRAALCHDSNLAQLARKHNNANVICFGERFINPQPALQAVKIFLNTDFEGGRHLARVTKLEDYGC